MANQDHILDLDLDPIQDKSCLAKCNANPSVSIPAVQGLKLSLGVVVMGSAQSIFQEFLEGNHVHKPPDINCQSDELSGC